HHVSRFEQHLVAPEEDPLRIRQPAGEVDTHRLSKLLACVLPGASARGLSEDSGKEMGIAGTVESFLAGFRSHRSGDRIRYPVTALDPRSVVRPRGSLQAGLHGKKVSDRDPRPFGCGLSGKIAP